MSSALKELQKLCKEMRMRPEIRNRQHSVKQVIFQEDQRLQVKTFWNANEQTTKARKLVLKNLTRNDYILISSFQSCFFKFNASRHLSTWKLIKRIRGNKPPYCKNVHVCSQWNIDLTNTLKLHITCAYILFEWKMGKSKSL